MTFAAYLTSLRPVLATLTGLPESAVIIVQQQDLQEAVGEAVGLAFACVLLGFTGGRSDVDPRAGLNSVANALEVEVWTPAVLMSGQELTTTALAEKIMTGLHGYKLDPDSRATTGQPKFDAWTLREETSDGADKTRYLVASLQFTTRLNPEA